MTEIERMMLVGGQGITKFDGIILAVGFLMICCMVAL